MWHLGLECKSGVAMCSSSTVLWMPPAIVGVRWIVMDNLDHEKNKWSLRHQASGEKKIRSEYKGRTTLGASCKHGWNFRALPVHCGKQSPSSLGWSEEQMFCDSSLSKKKLQQWQNLANKGGRKRKLKNRRQGEVSRHKKMVNDKRWRGGQRCQISSGTRVLCV